MAAVEEVEVVVARHERATLRVGDVFLKIDADQALASLTLGWSSTASTRPRQAARSTC